MCAADAVYSIHGLLSAGTAASSLLEIVKSSLLPDAAANSASAAASAAGTINGSSSSSLLGSSPLLASWAGRKWTECFNDAFDSLSRRKGQDLFMKGLHCYMGMRQALLRLGAPFASDRSGRVCNGKYVKVVQFDEELTDADRRVFTQPLPLAELGRYIIKLNRGERPCICFDECFTMIRLYPSRGMLLHIQLSDELVLLTGAPYEDLILVELQQRVRFTPHTIGITTTSPFYTTHHRCCCSSEETLFPTHRCCCCYYFLFRPQTLSFQHIVFVVVVIIVTLLSSADTLGRWRNRNGAVSDKPLIIVVKHPEGVNGKGFLTLLGLPVTEADDESSTTNFFDAFDNAASECARAGVCVALIIAACLHACVHVGERASCMWCYIWRACVCVCARACAVSMYV